MRLRWIMGTRHSRLSLDPATQLHMRTLNGNLVLCPKRLQRRFGIHRWSHLHSQDEPTIPKRRNLYQGTIMRIPSNIIWTSIGDFFRRWSGEKTKRNIEMLWQSMGQSASDALRYSNYYQKAQSPFSVDHWAAPAGLIKQSITKLDTSGEAAGRLIGYKGVIGMWSQAKDRCRNMGRCPSGTLPSYTDLP